MSIQQYFSDRGFDTIDWSFYSKIEQWEQWYQGKVKEFHSYRAYNGRKNVMCERLSLQMAKKVCEDWANLLMNEKAVHSALDSRVEAFDVDCVKELSLKLVERCGQRMPFRANHNNVLRNICLPGVNLPVIDWEDICM